MLQNCTSHRKENKVFLVVFSDTVVDPKVQRENRSCDLHLVTTTTVILPGTVVVHLVYTMLASTEKEK